jgi:L-Lysine epsilon oxidase N-terminal/L-lysine epsilon oxidase C-terminal domain
MRAEKTNGIRLARIHPGIGIARLGNSAEHFVGPEIPGVYDFPKGGFRDENNCLKRQGARFRILGYDERDRFVSEITEADARIEWTVHVRNTKAVGRQFGGVLFPDEPQRNAAWIKQGNSESELILDPKERTVSKTKPERLLKCKEFMGLKFAPVLELGRLLYEEGTGRLTVLGGLGRSGTPDPETYKIDHNDGIEFANHDGWFDDVSDGPVTAKVTLKDGRALYVKSAWVIVAPPKFAPELQNIVTLYDTLYQVAIDRGLISNPFSDPTFCPSFNRDIYPILRRADQMRWVFEKSNIGHDSFSTGPWAPNDRLHIFRQLRVPSGHPKEPGTGTGRMPYAWSDLYPDPAVSGTLTVTQYRMMEAWAEGRFEDDWDGCPPALKFEITPRGLDRAALEACVGAPFYPGIEASWKIRDVFGYVEPFRLDPGSLSPGDVSQQMSLPWQSDFVYCTYEDPYVWWPAQRPIDVACDRQMKRMPWDRVFDQEDSKESIDVHDMLHDFYRLGHVMRSGNEFFETGRLPDDPDPDLNVKNFRRQKEKMKFSSPTKKESERNQ